VRLWPDSSWKKYFIKYNIETNKFFVYPRSSYATNFGDSGVNHAGTSMWQVPLARGFSSPRFVDLEDSIARYDALCELRPESLKKLAPELAGYDLTLDLYGVRDKASIESEYVISRNQFSEHILSFGRELKPHELNVIDGFPGDRFKLGKTKDLGVANSFLGHRYLIYSDFEDTQRFFYQITPDHVSKIANTAPVKSEPEKTLPKPDIDDLLADITYLNQKTKQEADRLKTRIWNRAEMAEPADSELNSVVDDFSKQLGQLSTRILINDKNVEQLQESFNLSDSVGAHNTGQGTQITAFQLAGFGNFYAPESDDKGVSYIWTAADPEIQMSFPLSRRTRLEMQIRLYALIRPKFSKQLKLLIDGSLVKHKFKRHGSFYTASCELPASDTANRVDVKIVLPDTFSPEELGASNDTRKLGVAISEIRFIEPSDRGGKRLERFKSNR
jgi:hypothetical protein